MQEGEQVGRLGSAMVSQCTVGCRWARACYTERHIKLNITYCTCLAFHPGAVVGPSLLPFLE